MEIPPLLAYTTILIALSNAQDYRLPDTIIPLRYTLTFDIKPETNNFNGYSTIMFNTTQDTNQLQVHATPGIISITNVIYDQSKCVVTSTNETTEIVTIKCPDNFGADNNLVTIVFSGSYSEDARGIFKSYYEENGEKKVAVATQMEATFARRVFPCLDEPRLKAIFDITVIHPKEYRAVSNSHVLHESDEPDGIATQFEITPLMSTYLVAFVVSKFEVSSESDVFLIYTRPDVKQFTSTALTYGLPLIYKMGNWTNLDYFEMGNAKMEQVALQTLPIEAMENWGIITYEEMDQIDEGDNTAVDQKQRIVTVMAHELAHQWFGDLVTMDWWSDTWLNEGFATYFEYHLAAMLDDFNFDLERQFVSNILHSVLQKDSAPAEPLSNEDDDIETPDKIQAKFDDISYNKGACIIRMIKGVLGEEDFQKAIRLYLSEHQRQNTNPKDLLTVLQSVYKSEAYPLDVTMAPYIYQPGYPLVTVTKSGNNVTITQEEFKLEGYTNENLTWYVPISYTTSTEKKFHINITEWLEPNKSLNIELKDDWIIINLQQSGYYRVNYDNSLWDKLIAELKGKNRDEIDVLNRAQLVDDVFNNARNGKVSYEKAFLLAEYLKNETDYYPWVAYFNAVSYILDHIHDANTIKLIKKFSLKWIDTAFPENKSTDNSVIGVYTNLLINNWKCEFGDAGCLEYVKKSFDDFKNSSSFTDYNERYLILCHGLRSSPQDFDTVLQVFYNTDNAYARRVFLSSLACVNDSKFIDRFLSDFTIDNRTLTKQEAPTAIKAFINSGYVGIGSVLNLLVHWTIFMHDQFKGFFTINELLLLLAEKINNEEHAQMLYGIMNYSSPYIDDEVKQQVNQTLHVNFLWKKQYEKEIIAVLKNMDDGSGSNSGPTVHYSILMTVLMCILSKFVF